MLFQKNNIYIVDFKSNLIKMLLTFLIECHILHGKMFCFLFYEKKKKSFTFLLNYYK